MADISFAMEAKSDQLNAVDIMGFEPVITIRAVEVRRGDQPVWVFYEGDNNRPWKPSKGMIRILAAGWGRDSDLWIGKSVQIYMDETVKWAGKEVGGIRIRAMSDIKKAGITCTLTLNKQKRDQIVVKHLSMERPSYPADKFDKSFDAMVGKMQSGEWTLSQVIAKCQQTGDLTVEQMNRLQAEAPIDVDEGDGHVIDSPAEEMQAFNQPEQEVSEPVKTEPTQQQEGDFQGFE